MINLLAFDLGASSGRLMLCRYNGETMTLEEIHRFPNDAVRIGQRIYWDTLRLYHEMKVGMRKAAALEIEIKSFGIDAWGVDYGYLDKNGNMIGNPINYRDPRTDGIMERVDKILPLRELYESTGIQFMSINTVFQLYSDLELCPDIVAKADKLLMMPDLFGYFFTGEVFNEYTIMSTAQLLNARTKKIDYSILNRLGLRTDLYCDIVEPGTVIGDITNELAQEIGIGGIKLVAVGGHDTASAVAGVPAAGSKGAFLSCGTWSLIGKELSAPLISDESYANNYTNEGGVDNTIRFLKNINGLWIIQQLRKSYSERYGEITFPDIISAAKSVNRTEFCINPDDKAFTAPYNMYAEIIEHCEAAGQGKPEGLGEAAIAVYNGLTKQYKANIDKLERLTGSEIDCLNIVGGGIKDEFLCQETANVTGKKVITGPIEASVYGNAIMQLKALGEINSLEEGRQIIRNSNELRTYIKN